MKCPIDTTIDLVMTDRQGIEIDYCPTCRGVWLDRGELDKVIDRAAPQAAPQAAPAPPVAAPQVAPVAPYPSAPYPSAPYSAAPPADRRPRSWDDDDDYNDDRKYRGGEYRPKKRKSILGEIFDF